MNHARQRDRQIVREMAHAKARRFGKSIGPDAVTQAAVRRHDRQPYEHQPLPIVQPTALQRSLDQLRVEYVRDLYARRLLTEAEAHALVFGDK